MLRTSGIPSVSDRQAEVIALPRNSLMGYKPSARAKSHPIASRHDSRLTEAFSDAHDAETAKVPDYSSSMNAKHNRASVGYVPRTTIKARHNAMDR